MGGISHGERNGRARLTDAQAEELRVLRENELVMPGRKRYWTYDRLALRFGITKRAVIQIVQFERRTGIPEQW